jgi:hypothetical protein
MNNFMTMALSKEKDELRRLGILAARIYILRHRVSNLKDFNRDSSLPSIPAIDTTELGLNLVTANEEASDVEALETQGQGWSRIQMTEPGEVNGVRFLAGTIIDTQEADADKLIKSGKAVRIDEDGNTIEQLDNDPSNTDEAVQLDNGDNPADDIETIPELNATTEGAPDTSEAPTNVEKPDDPSEATVDVEKSADLSGAAVDVEQRNGDSEASIENDSKTKATIVDSDTVDAMLDSIDDNIEKEGAKS